KDHYMVIAGLLLFVGASVGHVALLVFSLNRLYGLPLPRWLLLRLRMTHALLALAGILVFGLAFDALLASPEWSWRGLLTAYAVLCATVGLAWLPLLTVRRGLRRAPAALLSNHTRLVDVAAELGHKPAGRGKHRFLALLPG